MPRLTFDPSENILDTTVSTNTASTISALATLCSATSLNFSALAVLTNVKRSLDHSVKKHPTSSNFVQTLQKDVETALDELFELNMIDPSLTPGFINSKKPVLSVLTRLPSQAPAELFETVGNMLTTAYLTDVAPPASRFKRLNALTSSIRNEPALTELQATELQTLLNRSRDDLIETLTQRLSTESKPILHFNARLLIHLRSNLNSEHVAEQRCANQRQYLTGAPLIKAISDLKTSIENGETTALITLIGFCVGLSWDLTTQIPLLRGESQPGVLMWVDPFTGMAHVSIKELLNDLGQPIEGCEPTTDTFRLPLPLVIAEHLRITAVVTPMAKRIGDLVEAPNDRVKNLDDYWSASHRARFIRSAATNAIRMKPNRCIAAFAFLSFHLVTKPDLHYLTITETQIWALRSEFFKSVGLGSPVPTDHLSGTSIGSKRTVLSTTVCTVFEELDHAVAEVRIGRRYSLVTLIDHHNRYVRRVAMYLHFSAGGRGSRHIDFNAASWFSGSMFGYLNDKDAGAAGGRTPIPIAPSTAEQLRLWELHLRSLRARLDKILGYRARSTSEHILEILDHRPVSIFFLLNADSTFRPLLAEDLFVGCAKALHHDFGRHYMASTLTARNQPLSEVHGFLRHQGEGLNPQSAFGVEIQHDRLVRSALAVNMILSDLNIRPLTGLGGGAQ